MTTILERARAMIAGTFPEPGITKLLGARLVAIDLGSARITLETDERHANPMGTVHGGVLCDIADAAMGMAYASALEEGETFTTLELKINFLRPVRKALLQADGIVVQRGRTVGLTECSITDEKGRLIAKATSTCLTLRGDQAAGR
ncbi:MAG TPA: PaaI family thioesterase [Vicinamibacterales bacterium]|jgi:uncharacterized protein (TIGR00369 family)|nr:PaaI family thioesterase [Vicinamibacterales bacterium]